MHISSFEDLLVAARQQPEPQRLLFVFTRAELPEGASDEERARFERGEGGALAPVMCVDKTPDDIPSYAALVAESAEMGRPWDVVFVGGLGGAGGALPTEEQTDRALDRMLRAVQAGDITGLLAFRRDGAPLAFG